MELLFGGCLAPVVGPFGCAALAVLAAEGWCSDLGGSAQDAASSNFIDDHIARVGGIARRTRRLGYLQALLHEFWDRLAPADWRQDSAEAAQVVTNTSKAANATGEVFPLCIRYSMRGGSTVMRRTARVFGSSLEAEKAARLKGVQTGGFHN